MELRSQVNSSVERGKSHSSVLMSICIRLRLCRQLRYLRVVTLNKSNPIKAILALSVVTFSWPLSDAVSRAQDKPPVTVADTIRMTVYGDAGYINGLSAKYDVARFSPDGEQFAILVKKGNLETNTNDYSLLLFRTRDALHSPRGEVLASFSSSSNRPAIQDVMWLDNKTIAFLGENPGDVQQLYTVDSNTKSLNRLTDHPTSLIAYAMAGKDRQFFFMAEEPVRSLCGDPVQRAGLVVGAQALSDLIGCKDLFWSHTYFDLFAQGREGVLQSIRIPVPGGLSSSFLSISPDGRYLIIQVEPRNIPAPWKRYSDQQLQHALSKELIGGGPRFIYQYHLFDTKLGTDQPLMDSPIGHGYTDATWLPDSRSVVISGTYLPLDVANPRERTKRELTRYVAEVSLPSLQVTPITSQEVKVRRWDAQTGTLFLQLAKYGTVDSEGGAIGYRKKDTGWERVAASTRDFGTSHGIQVTLNEDMNTPPRFYVRNQTTGQSSVLFDPNPQFATLTFGHVENISFKARNGNVVRAGLYLPAKFIQGMKYPLVIQTHGWNPERFWVNGPYSTAFAAQPLAGAGFVVLQAELETSLISTPKECDQAQSLYEGAVDYLNGLGMIDINRLGIIGFSRTGLTVKCTLVRSKYRFAAATVADGSDGGYFAYLASLNSFPQVSLDSERVNAGVPFGDGTATWLRNAPGFNLDKVNTPIRLEANGPASLLYAWEWYVGLLRLNKPVELIYQPDADHVIFKPSERLTSEQGNVDWFAFWLEGREDPSPSKADQYARWHKLRRLAAAKVP